jgi:hypothetical protein
MHVQYRRYCCTVQYSWYLVHFLILTMFESSYPSKRVYRRYAATPGMIRYTLSLDLTMFRTDRIKNLSRVRSMTVRYKGLRTHAVQLYKKIKGERMIRVKIRIEKRRRRRKGREKKCTEEKI